MTQIIDFSWKGDKEMSLIKKIQKNLSSDLLKGKWKIQSSPLEGHCYIATEALYHILNNNEWTPMCASYSDESGKCTHWWLMNKITHEILDPTKEQYLPDEPPYHLGRGNGFLTKLPSKRAKILIGRVINSER